MAPVQKGLWATTGDAVLFPSHKPAVLSLPLHGHGGGHGHGSGSGSDTARSAPSTAAAALRNAARTDISILSAGQLLRVGYPVIARACEKAGVGAGAGGEGARLPVLLHALLPLSDRYVGATAILNVGSQDGAATAREPSTARSGVGGGTSATVAAAATAAAASTSAAAYIESRADALLTRYSAALHEVVEVPSVIVGARSGVLTDLPSGSGSSSASHSGGGGGVQHASMTMSRRGGAGHSAGSIQEGDSMYLHGSAASQHHHNHHPQDAVLDVLEGVGDMFKPLGRPQQQQRGGDAGGNAALNAAIAAAQGDEDTGPFAPHAFSLPYNPEELCRYVATARNVSRTSREARLAARGKAATLILQREFVQ